MPDPIAAVGGRLQRTADQRLVVGRRPRPPPLGARLDVDPDERATGTAPRPSCPGRTRPARSRRWRSGRRRWPCRRARSTRARRAPLRSGSSASCRPRRPRPASRATSQVPRQARVAGERPAVGQPDHDELRRRGLGRGRPRVRRPGTPIPLGQLGQEMSAPRHPGGDRRRPARLRRSWVTSSAAAGATAADGDRQGQDQAGEERVG